MIQFDTLFTSYVPGSQVEIGAVPALKGLLPQPYKLLLVGPRLAAGGVVANQAVRVTNKAQGAAWFGRGSVLAGMIEAAIAAVAAGAIEITACAYDDAGGGTAGTRTVTITGTATAAGTLALMIAGVKVPVAVAVGDTATIVGASIVAAITANPDLPVTATNAAGVVTLTCRHKGTVGVDLDVRTNYYDQDRLPAGITCAIAVGVVGATNPDITATLAALGDEQYHAVALAVNDAANLTACDTEFNARWGPSEQIEGRVYVGVSDTFANCLSKAQTRNGIFTTLICMADSPTPTWRVAAAAAAVAAVNLQVDPAMPLTNLPLPGVLAPRQGFRFTRAERNQLLKSGGSTLRVLAGGVVAIERLVSSYTQNAAGFPDVSYTDITTTATLGYMRYTWRQRMASRFARAKLTSDTINAARAETIAIGRDWYAAGLLKDFEAFKAAVVVEQDGDTPSQMNFLLPTQIVSPWISSAARLEFAL